MLVRIDKAVHQTQTVKPLLIIYLILIKLVTVNKSKLIHSYLILKIINALDESGS